MSKTSPFSQILMLLEDKYLKKSIPVQLNRRRSKLLLNEIKKQIQEIINFFKSSKAITQGGRSKITLRN